MTTANRNQKLAELISQRDEIIRKRGELIREREKLAIEKKELDQELVNIQKKSQLKKAAYLFMVLFGASLLLF